MLNITCPEFCREEIEYTLEVVFSDRLDVAYTIDHGPSERLSIEKSGKKLTIGLAFFETLNSQGRIDTTNVQHLPIWNKRAVSWNIELVKDEIPVIFGKPEITQTPSSIDIEIDIFGSIFFMISRYEEINSDQFDQYGRFPSRASLAYRCGFLMRPIVDEYIEILWAAINQLWPETNRREDTFNIVPTHDVDMPFLNIGLTNFRALAQRLGGDLIKRKSFTTMYRTLFGWLRYKLNGDLRYKNDPYDVFGRLLEIGEKHNVKSNFYFMTTNEKQGVLGGRYDILSEDIKCLITDLSAKGHEIGIHPTGNSFKDEQAFSSQAEEFFAMKQELGIGGLVGGRQHYLLWLNGVTPLYWEKFGFDYDSTLTYADHVGFRCGTCKEFNLWNQKLKQKMSLIERPLIMMEGSLLVEGNMNMESSDARDVIISLKDACRVVNGEFIFLWHNSSFASEEDWKLYELCLSHG